MVDSATQTDLTFSITCPPVFDLDLSNEVVIKECVEESNVNGKINV